MRVLSIAIPLFLAACSPADILALKAAARTTCAGARGACALVETACRVSDAATAGGEAPAP